MKTTLTAHAASLVAARSGYGTVRDCEDLLRHASKAAKKKE